MIYAIVTTYKDGNTRTDYINQQAIPANKNDAFLSGFNYTDRETGHNILYIEYAAAIHPENRIHPIERGNVIIDTANAESVKVFNVDTTDGKYVLENILSMPFTAK